MRLSMLSNEFIDYCKREKLVLLFLFGYSFLLLFFCSAFSPLYPFNGWSDVNIYYTIGKGIAFDLIPYKDLFDHKGPLIFFIYVLGYILVPDSYTGMYIVESVFFFFTLSVVYTISKMFLNRTYSILSTLTFPFFFLSFSMFGGAAEEFIIPFQGLFLLFFVYYFKNGKILSSRLFYFVLGSSLAIIFFVKLNLIIIWFLPLLFVVIRLIRNKEYEQLISSIVFGLAGFLLITIPLLLYFYLNDALFDFYHAYILVNKGYGTISDIDIVIRSLRTTVGYFIRSFTALLPFVLSGLGLMYFLFFLVKKVNLDRCIFLASFVLTFLYIYSVPFFFHYYYLSLVIFSVLACISLYSYLERKFKFSIHKSFVYVFICLSLFLYVGQKKLFGYSINNLLNRDFPESFESLLYNEMSKKANPSFVCLGVDNSIALFTLMKIVPKQKFFFTPNLRYDIYPEMFETQRGYIENNEVDFFMVRRQSFYTEVLLNNNYFPVIKYGDYWLFKLND